jgi:hypothetical protein
VRYILLALFFSTNSFAYDFKGVEVGQFSSTEDISNKLTAKCLDNKDDGGIYCLGDTTIVGKKAEVFITADKNNIVQTIKVTFDPDSFENIYSALKSKYGAAKVKVSDISTAMGAKFKQAEAKWSTSTAFMMLNKYNGKITEGSLMILSNEHLEMMDKLMKESKSDI